MAKTEAIEMEATVTQALPNAMFKIRLDGTDKEINNADYGAAPEGSDFLVIGHEGFGVVEEVGSNVSGLKPGDFVIERAFAEQ